MEKGKEGPCYFAIAKGLKIRKEVKRNRGVRSGMQCMGGRRFGPPCNPHPTCCVSFAEIARQKAN